MSLSRPHGSWLLGVGLSLLLGCSSSERSVTESPNTTETQPASPPSTVAEKSVEPSATPPVKPAVKPPPKPVESPPPTPRELEFRKLLAELTYQEAGKWKVRKETAEAVEQQTGDVTDYVVTLLRDKSVDIRRGAVFYLFERFEPENKRMTEAFLAAVADDDPTVRRMATQVVSRLPDETFIQALPQIGSAVQSDQQDATFRATLVRRIGSLNEAGGAALPLLTSVAKSDASPNVRAAAVAAVAKVSGERAGEHLELFRAALADADVQVRVVAVARLKSLAATANPAVRDLATALGDAEPKVRDAARDALSTLGSAAAPAAAGQLRHAQPATRRAALIVLGRLGPAARLVAAEIRQCLTDADPSLRKLAEQALARIEVNP